MKSGGVKLVLCVQTIPLVKRCGRRSVFHMSVKKPILTFHRVGSVVAKNAILILHFTRHVFNLRDTEIVICLILVL